MRTLSLLLVGLIVFASCRNQELIRPGDSLEVAFEKAYGMYEQERWQEAARGFDTIVSMGRGTSVGQEAQFYLAESYFNSRQYLIAASEYERYSSFYPNSPKRQEADFKQAISYYHLSPRYNLDQSHTYRAIEQMRLFIARYPNSERISEAGQYIDELLGKLARKKYEAGNFYMRSNRRYNAAAITFEQVVDRYPGTEWAERALAKQVEAYILYADHSVPERRAERYEKAIESYHRYVQLFPVGGNRQEVEDLYDQARLSLQEVAGNTEPEDESESLTAQGN